MGCLSFIFDVLLDSVLAGWYALMTWIVPKKVITKRTYTVLRIFVGILAALIFISVLLGLFAMISDDPDTRMLGKYMVFIPLGLSAVQIIGGIAVRVRSKKK